MITVVRLKFNTVNQNVMGSQWIKSYSKTSWHEIFRERTFGSMKKY